MPYNEKKIKLEDESCTEIVWDGESVISVSQDDLNGGGREVIMLFDEEHAKVIVALIRYAASQNKWKM